MFCSNIRLSSVGNQVCFWVPIGTMLVLASVSEPSAKADINHPLLAWTPANERLLEQGIEVPERALPGWLFPNGTGPSPGTKAALMLSLCDPRPPCPP
eukprot:1141702-Pelagomonas_calceolata.AAC.1